MKEKVLQMTTITQFIVQIVISKCVDHARSDELIRFYERFKRFMHNELTTSILIDICFSEEESIHFKSFGF